MQYYSFIEKYILKKRYVFYYDLNETFEMTSLAKVVDFSLSEKSILANFVISSRLREYIQKREGQDVWRLFLYIENHQVLGYSFLHTPFSTEWNDSLPTYKHEARESSTYVEVSARGKGIRGILLASQKKYCLEQNRKMWCVIEAANEASIKSTKKSGVISIEKNYLLKLWGRNIVSILMHTLKIFFLWGEKRATR
ncbi:hypothetical protein LF296_18060 [Acinetobacter vivianii]|uniref:N-acetyltransferase domain-containing protein n=1 Tax=Acinetobacter vivianii TaxID=1776742 RepID=A0AAJ6NIU5_9GAMM|nr:hypothetical protein [Acinetobacter vivianii]WDZ51161.1 hypothetical protein LF296_18060 [Acinetobacter vivianii]